MAFIGNTNTTQAFTPAVDYFSGNASTTAFTLSRPVASVAQVQAVVNNVAQNPSSAFTVSGNTITFTSAPSSGTNNIYVYYTSPITQVIAPGQGTVGTTQLQNGLTVNFADGTAAAPSITNDGDTNTGVFYPAADTVGVSTGGSERMRVDSSGNVGIGYTSMSQKLQVNGNIALAASTGLLWDTNGSWQISSDDSTYIRFVTSGSEKMRVDSSGYVGIGTTSPSTFGFLAVENTSNFRAGWFYVNAASSLSTPAASFVKKDNNTTTSQVLVNFYTNGSATTQGQINANGANAAAFGSFSDSRLKENIVDLPSQLANIMALRPVEFDYIESEGGGHQIGFIAQDVQEIYPDLVGEREDGMFTLSDLNKNDARLIKAIQEMKAIIDTQANTITALTARIEALENK